jgi:hypothetical protein
MRPSSFQIAQLAPIAFMAILAGPTACRGENPRERDQFLFNFKTFAAALARADRVVLFEGLPHQVDEEALLEKELETKKVVWHLDFPFYEKPLQLRKGDAKRLTGLFADVKSFLPILPDHDEHDRVCVDGVFHPDYCLEWHIGKAVYRCLVCFGCDEMQVSGPEVEIYCEMGQEVRTRLREALQPYRKQRPEPAPAVEEWLLP